MPDSQTPNDLQEPNGNLSAFQRYLLQEKHLVEQYQQVTEGFVAECKTQHPEMSAETEASLNHYFVTYIARGADPALINFKALGNKNPDEIMALEDGIPDKLTPESRDRFARLCRPAVGK